jgi:hypothetical protein
LRDAFHHAHVLPLFWIDEQSNEVDRKTIADVRVGIVDRNDHFPVGEQIVVFRQQLQSEQLADRPGLFQRIDRRGEIRRLPAIQPHLESVAKHGCLKVIHEQLQGCMLERDALQRILERDGFRRVVGPTCVPRVAIVPRFIVLAHSRPDHHTICSGRIVGARSPGISVTRCGLP